MKKTKISDYLRCTKVWITVGDLAEKLGRRPSSVSEFLRNNSDLFIFTKGADKRRVFVKRRKL